jgi:hypothetical protein
MKIVWEPQDIRAGRRVRKPTASEEWLIGYDPSAQEAHKYMAIISLADGMISAKGMDPQGIADFLNEAGNFPVELLPP